MLVVDKIKKAVQRDIMLHDTLKNLVLKERHLFGKNRLDDIEAINKQRILVEREIESTNETIKTLVGVFVDGGFTVEPEQKKNIFLLMNNLHKSIRESIKTIEETGKVFKNIKYKTAQKLRSFGKRREAINSYVQNI